ncbi:hypothetical protein [Croceimicrobium sp.]|uniref:hypothetical protein n=1 Tax=Croceimicrobium sp. TaxID=2828340 RepID=UPI003BAC30BA
MKIDDWMKEHRTEFDQAEAPEGIWSELKKAIPEKSKPRNFKAWTVAAALVLGLSIWWIYPEKQLPPEPETLLPESFLKQEEGYQADLKMIESNLDLNQLRHKPEYDWVFEELAELEKINQRYRDDIDELVPREELITVLIDNYEKRLRLLQRIQMELERNQKHVQNENINL